MSQYPAKVKIVEVGARDGLQNELSVATEAKISLVNALKDAGLKHIEAGA
ncbi:hydroxymethylglutaryl-CoA lyase, partial [Pseudoalteromonas piscicida]